MNNNILKNKINNIEISYKENTNYIEFRIKKQFIQIEFIFNNL